MIDIHAVDPSPDRVVHVYAAPEGCALDDREAWLAANPALASWKPYEAIEGAAAEAMRKPVDYAKVQEYGAPSMNIPAQPYYNPARSKVRKAYNRRIRSQITKLAKKASGK